MPKNGKEDAPSKLTELQILLEGVFDRRGLLELIRCFVVVEDLGADKMVKKLDG